MNSQIKTVFLLVSLSALFLLAGYGIGGARGAMTALVLSLGMNLFSYWYSDRVVLAMHQAKPMGPGHPSGVYETVQELSQRAGLPMPRVYSIAQAAPNAFATGRDPEHAALAVTEGLLQILGPRELCGVLAHELGHIRNRDILISTAVASLASAVMYLAHMAQWFGFHGHSRAEQGRGPNPLVMIITVVLAPLAATLIRFAISRNREYLADDAGADILGDPEALASALSKISDPRLVQALRQENAAEEMQPAFSHLYIVNHFGGESILSLFSTHPPVRERIRRLTGR